MTAFSDTTFALDAVRVLVATLALFVAGYQVILMFDARTPGQRVRCAGVATSMLLIGALRLQHLGETPLTWDAYVGAVAVGLLTWGSYAWRNEVPATVRR